MVNIKLHGRFAWPGAFIFFLSCGGAGSLLAQRQYWHHTELTAFAGVPRIDGEMTGVQIGDTDARLYYLDGNRHVIELAREGNSWLARDLTRLIGAPAGYEQPMAAFRAGASGIRVYYRDRNFHIQELAYTNGAWQRRDITAASGAPPARDLGPLSAFPVAGTDSRVYFLNDGRVQEIAYYQGGWHHRDVSAATDAPRARNLEWAVFAVAETDPRIYYLDSSEHIQELAYYQRGWHHRDLTADTGTPLAKVGFGITGFAVGPGQTDARVYYGDSSENVSELAWYQGGWHHRNITRELQLGVRSDGLVGFGGGTSRVYCNCGDVEILELSYYQNGWHARDPIRLTGAPSPSFSDRVVAFDGAGSDRRVYYQSQGGRIHELGYYADIEDNEPTERTVTLERQPVWEGFIPYLGRFPAFGVVPSGRMTQIRVPQIGPVDTTIYFVKAGRSTKECGNPEAVIPLDEGRSTTSQQIQAIFGQSEPRFSTTSPLFFVACIGSSSGEIPNWRDIKITVRYD